MSLFYVAKDFALARHGSQKYGDQSYGVHLRTVVDVLCEYGVREDWLLAAAWLHDTVEDTDTTVKEVEEMFGLKVAMLVEAVSGDPKKSRKVRNLEVYEKLKALPHALVLKLADRIANVRSSKANSPSLFAMYKKEHVGFREHLYAPYLNDLIALRMWAELDKLFAEVP